MTTAPGEPDLGPSVAVPLAEVVARLRGAPTTGRPRVVAVDGRGGSGKSTLAGALQQVTGWPVVATDDVAWHTSFFGWDGLLVRHVLAPLHAGAAITWRPAAWQERGRPGAVEVPAGAEVVLVEGTGSSRRALLPWLDAAVWVRCDLEQARCRALVRDGGRPQDAAFWDEWQEQELPFLAHDRPWERADVVVDGTPAPAPPPGSVAVARPRPGAR